MSQPVDQQSCSSSLSSSMNNDVAVMVMNRALRLDDNPALQAACKHRHVICVYLENESLFSYPSSQSVTSRTSVSDNSIQLGPWFQPLGEHRQSLLINSLSYVDQILRPSDQSLWVVQGNGLMGLSLLIEAAHVTHIYYVESAGYNENAFWRRLKANHESIFVRAFQAHSMFTQSQLPFVLDNLPTVFTEFRKAVENIVIEEISLLKTLSDWKSLSLSESITDIEHIISVDAYAQRFHIAQCSPLKATDYLDRIDQYFASDYPLTYKQTRNQLHGENNSSAWSVPLSLGLVSPRDLVRKLKDYEHTRGANESTYWLWFELLWREYFYWYSRKWQQKLFSVEGIKKTSPLTSFYPQRFAAWCAGRTPKALVNACMNELNQAGLLSNRGRQIVASYLVNELQVDWRYGAAWFERQLLDYDVASNWGNWQYIAGVGADPRGGRHMNIEKQREYYDADGDYTRRWGGNDQVQTMVALDAIDYVGWPSEAHVAVDHK